MQKVITDSGLELPISVTEQNGKLYFEVTPECAPDWIGIMNFWRDLLNQHYNEDSAA